MMEYDNTNKISLWPNDKRQSDSHPSHKSGKPVTLQCPCCNKKYEAWASGWVRAEGANPNSPSMSISLQPVENQGGYTQQQPSGTGGGQYEKPTQTAPAQNPDDNIPFANPYKHNEYLV